MKRKPVYPKNWSKAMKDKHKVYLDTIKEAKAHSGWQERVVMQYEVTGENNTGSARRLFFANGFGVSLQMGNPTTFNIVFLVWHDDPRDDENWVVCNLASVTDGELTDIVFWATALETYKILDKVSELS